MKEVSIEKARAKLGDIVDHARYTGNPTLITRHGKPAGLIVPVLGISDLGSIAIARKMVKLNDPREDEHAREMLADMLYILDRYLVADKNLDSGVAKSKTIRASRET